MGQETGVPRQAEGLRRDSVGRSWIEGESPRITLQGGWVGRGTVTKALCYTVRMELSQFEGLVHRALDQIPDALSAYLDNVDIVVEDWPAQDQLAGHVIEEGDLLLGLYEGVPLTERAEYGMVLPDKITLFKRSIEALCATNEEIIEQVRETVVHEVAHHFGIDDERLRELGV